MLHTYKLWLFFFSLHNLHLILYILAFEKRSIVKQALAHKSVVNFNPDCIVLQLGLDGLLGDPHKQFALTEKFYSDATKHLLNQAYPELPFLILGGGGYNPQECAKCWTSVTSSILNVELDRNLPEHSHLAQYGPNYCIHTEENYTSMNRPDLELDSFIKFLWFLNFFVELNLWFIDKHFNEFLFEL